MTIFVKGLRDVPLDFTGMVNFDHGAIAYYKDGKLHRDNAPAFIWRDYSRDWYQNGIMHREDGPAMISSNGRYRWYLNGKKFLSKEVWFERLTSEQKIKALFNPENW